MSWLQTRSVGWRYALSGGSVLALTLLLLLLPGALEQTDIALLYLLAVLISATTFGLGPAIVASLLAFLCSNFFFVSPRYTLAVNSPEDLLRLVVFLIVAISTSSLAGRVRHEATVAQARSQELTTLYTLSQAISAEVDRFVRRFSARPRPPPHSTQMRRFVVVGIQNFSRESGLQ